MCRKLGFSRGGYREMGNLGNVSSGSELETDR